MALRINKQKNNKSGFTGVWYRKDRRAWVATIESKRYHLKVSKQFHSLEEANRWRVEYLSGRPDLVADHRPNCSKCKKRKDVKDFNVDRSRARGVETICRECSRKKQKARYAKHLKSLPLSSLK